MLLGHWGWRPFCRSRNYFCSTKQLGIKMPLQNSLKQLASKNEGTQMFLIILVKMFSWMVIPSTEC